jgi:conjugal transfer pilus assembly protein TraF
MKLMLFCLLLPFKVFGSPFFASHTEGWFWYQNETEAMKKLKSPRVPLLSPTEAMLKLRQQVEDSLNLAILNPTQTNLKNYATHYFDVIHRAQQFSDGYKVMLLNYPQFDYSLRFPTSHLMQPLYEIKEQQSIEAKILQFTQNHGFFFFLSSRCTYCQAFAPIVKQFADKYHVSLIPISLDGKTLPEFPHAKTDNGTAARFKIYRVPALYAVNPHTQQVIPIAHGLLSLSQLEENILKLIKVNHE